MIPVIQRATDADYMAFFGNFIPGWVVFYGGERVALVGFLYRALDDRWWGYFNIKPGLPKAATTRIVLEIKRNLNTVEEDVYVTCDEVDHAATAPRLLRAWGFHPTGEYADEMEMAIWMRPGTKGE